MLSKTKSGMLAALVAFCCVIGTAAVNPLLKGGVRFAARRAANLATANTPVTLPSLQPGITVSGIRGRSQPALSNEPPPVDDEGGQVKSGMGQKPPTDHFENAAGRTQTSTKGLVDLLKQAGTRMPPATEAFLRFVRHAAPGARLRLGEFEGKRVPLLVLPAHTVVED